MICTSCGVYMDAKSNHIWRLELRDAEPGSDIAALMLGVALCQDCAMDIVKEVKVCKSHLTEAKNDRMS